MKVVLPQLNAESNIRKPKDILLLPLSEAMSRKAWSFKALR